MASELSAPTVADRWQRALDAGLKAAPEPGLDAYAHALAACLEGVTGLAIVARTETGDGEVIGASGTERCRRGQRGMDLTSADVVWGSASHDWGVIVEGPPAPTGAMRRSVAKLIAAAGIDIDLARARDAERRSRLAASHSRRHVELLLDASTALQTAVDLLQPALDRLAGCIVPTHADFFAVRLLDEPGGAAVAASGQVRFVEAWLGLQSSDLPVDATETSIAAEGRLERLGLGSWGLFPVRAFGSVVGVAAVGTVAPRRGLRASDIAAFEDLSSRIGTATERVALYRRSTDATAAAVRSERRARTLIDASPMAVVELSADGKIHAWNAAASSLLGRTPGAVMHPDAATALLGLWDRAGEATIVDERMSLARADGTRAEVSIAASIVPGDEDRTHAGLLLCVISDIGARLALERTSQQRQRMEALGRLAGAVAHDFNNLLTVIVGYSDLLASQLGSDHPLAADVDAIRAAGNRAAILTEQLLTISRRRVDEHAVVDVTAAVAGMREVLTCLMGDDIETRTSLDPTAGRIRVDVGQLEQVLLNLVVNARAAMTAGGIVSITTRPRGATEAELVVEDTGVGMDQATADRCFEPFFSNHPSGPSTGLGLATVYSIVNQAGGRIALDSSPGAGSRFTITFPTVADAADATPAAASQPAEIHPSETVLLVEDDPAVSAFAEAVLSRSGYVVRTAATGADALEAWAECTEPPTAIVTDVVMPGMSGVDLAEALAQDDPHVRVLFMSGCPAIDDDGPISDAMLEGRFLPKPFTARDLLGAVARLIRGDPAAAQSDTRRP